MVSERTVGHTVIRLRKGDITSFEGDAIVNAANSGLWMGSGVAGAIKRFGGESIEREAMGKAPIEPGEAVVTDAGALKARYVIHAAVMGDDLATSEALIKAATQNSLYKCDELNIQTVAFPGPGGPGVGTVPGRQMCSRHDRRGLSISPGGDRLLPERSGVLPLRGGNLPILQQGAGEEGPGKGQSLVTRNP